MPASDISARHFEIFLTMALSRSMAEAADKLGVSQAAVSKSLKILEQESGLSLFRLVNGRLRPTAAAERLLPHAQRALDHLDRARTVAQELSGGDIGQITIGVAGPALVSILPAAVQRFRAESPEVRLNIQIENAHGLLEKVAGTEVDLGIGTPPVRGIDARLLQLCHVRDICDTALVVVMRQQHRLAQRPTIRPQDLANETLIALPEESATTHMTAAMFQQAGVAFHAGVVVGNAVGVCSLVQQGIGIGLVNALMLAQQPFPDVIARPFRPRVTLRTCLYHSKLDTPSAATLRFMEYLANTARQTTEVK